MLSRRVLALLPVLALLMLGGCALPDAGLPSYLADRTRDIRIVGTIEEPNLEAIAALDPDLIISNEVRHPEIYDQLSGIAPTVYAAEVNGAWKDTLRLVGDALNKRADADRLLDGHLRKAEELGRRFGDPAATEISMVRFTGGSVRLYGRGSCIGTILDDAGFGRPPSYGDEGAADRAAVAGGPLWSALPVVRAGKAHEVSDDPWYLGIGPIAGGRVLEELARYAP